MLKNKFWFILSIYSLASIFLISPAQAQLDFQFSQTLETGLRASSIVSGDLNGDGSPDLIVSNIFSHNFSVFLNDGNGNFTEEAVEIPLQEDLLHPISVAVGDIDGDGLNDLAAAQFQSLGGSDILPLSDASILFLYNNGELTFEQQSENIIGVPSRVKIFDLDEDGMNDVIVGNNGEISFGNDGSIGQFDGGIYPYMNLGNRTFVESSPATDFDFVGSVVDFVPMDYNNDGLLDIVGADQGKPVVTQFLEFIYLDPGFNLFRNTVSGLGVEGLEDLDYQPWSIDKADFNNDDQEDIVLSIIGEIQDLTSLTGNQASIQVYTNNNGNFSELVTINASGVVFAVEANDYDMDGDIDIIATIQEIEEVGQNSVLLVPSLRFYENDSSNQFTEVLSFSIQEEPRYSAVDDFDADGDLDVAALCTIRDTDRSSNAEPGVVYVYNNLAINESSVDSWSVY